ncbi:RNA cytosine-C(5)-methyltransferase NSUN2-like [Watersipora subatra]|uniref:RNA cytosine-C(5)-methyltransferase NSUN2-like n=1 Tax=Watersipora subatra TaxID=2589382 RepID=UPI00355B767C
MGRSNRKKQKEHRKGLGQKTTERKPKAYKDTIRENALFVDYYKKQQIVDDEDWEEFMQCIREPLPAAFRVTGSKSQAEQLLHLIKHTFFKQLNTSSESQPDASLDSSVHGEVSADTPPIESLEIKENGSNTHTAAPVTVDDGTTDDTSKESPLVKPPRCLSWYPDGLAWQLEYSRVSIRQNQTLKKLHSFLVSESESGNISRQEAVSMIPPLLMDIKSHHKILDMCAAPGSKTAQMIEYLHADSDDPMPDGFVIGNDVDNKRCYLMVHQVKRLQSPNFMIVNHDATRLPSMTFADPVTSKEQPLLFDRILCDVPCSGDGTLRKNPEVWRTWGPGHAINLHSVQNRVLTRGLELLTVGGRLVYSTCSFNPIENEAVIAHMINKCEGSIQLVDCSKELPELRRAVGLKTWRVLTKNGDWFASFENVPDNKRSWVRPSMFPASNMDDIHIDRCLRIVPHHQNTGGFFVAVLEKIKSLPWQKVAPDTDKFEPVVEKAEAKEAVEEQSDTTTPSEEPPNKKIKYVGFREEPFFYLKKDNSQWPSIKKFFGFDETFDETQLMVRSKENEKKRNIYLSSKSIRNIALCNEHKIKYINTGVKVFARSEHVLCDCSYRLVQDGISSVSKYVHGRRVTVIKSDVIALLTQENPFISELSPATQTAIFEIGVGGMVMLYRHVDSETSTESDILMTGWRGKTSCRVYVPKFERHHILRLCGVDPSVVLLDSEWAVKGKTDTSDQTEEAEVISEIADDDSKSGSVDQGPNTPGPDCTNKADINDTGGPDCTDKATINVTASAVSVDPTNVSRE